MSRVLNRFETRRSKEIGFLVAVLLLTLVALSPLLRDDQPCTHDGGLHYYRIVAMRHMLGDGLLASRWVPDLAFGYGYPFFNYRAAVSYYTGLGLYLMGFTLPQALNLVYVLALVASAVGAYLLGRDLFGRPAGLVAAVAYVYAPYPMIDALVRGNMPESVALALLPFILWSFRRLLLGGRMVYFLSSTALLALLCLSHNISSLLFAPFLVLFLLVIWLARGRKGYWPRALGAVAAGIALAAFYWAPAILEQDAVQLYLSSATRNNDYHYNFVNLAEAFAPPQPVDSALLNPPLRLPLGLPVVILALLGVGLALWRWWPAPLVNLRARVERRERLAHVLLFAFSAGAMVFMATRASLPVWENLPLIPFVQFPWRFIGRAGLPLALLAAAFVGALADQTAVPAEARSAAGRGKRRTFAGPPVIWSMTLVVVTSLVLLGLPLTYPAAGYCPAKPDPNILDLFAYERSTGLVGADPLGSYFPVTVIQRPVASPLEAQYASILASAGDAPDEPVARFDPGMLPQDVVIHRAQYAPNHAVLDVETAEAGWARYLAFDFPGWQVWVDGRRVETRPSQPEGLITFPLPAGQHTVEVKWGSTPIRSAGSALSGLALAGVGLVALAGGRNGLVRRRRRAKPGEPLADSEVLYGVPRGDRFGWIHLGGLVALALLLLGFKLLIVDRTATPFRHAGLDAAGSLPGIDVPMNVAFEDGVRLLGYDQNVATMPADGTLHLAFYWSASAPPSRSYRATVTLVGPDDQLWSSKNAFPRRGYSDLPPSPTWGSGRYAVDGLDVEPLAGTPPGVYQLRLTAFDRETLAPLNVLDAAGGVAGPSLSLGEVKLLRPARAPQTEDVAMQWQMGVALGPLELVGLDLDREEAAPGDPMLITLFWRGQAQEALPALAARLALVSVDGEPVQTWELPPVRADWPTAEWQPGELWRGPHLLRLAGGLESGTYGWQLQVYGVEAPGELYPAEGVELGRLRIDAPERRWEAPSLPLRLEVDLGGQVTLVGAEVLPEEVLAEGLAGAGEVRVRLVWQGRAEMAQSYRVFVHLLGPGGELVAQSDGEPVGWTRPTTGWAAGEVVEEERVLEVPGGLAGGVYRLVAGMYNPETGERLPLAEGGDAVLITPLTIIGP